MQVKFVMSINKHVMMSSHVGAKFYFPQATAAGNQRIRIREKTLEFSSTVLSTLAPYHCLLAYCQLNSTRINSTQLNEHLRTQE